MVMVIAIHWFQPCCSFGSLYVWVWTTWLKQPKSLCHQSLQKSEASIIHPYILQQAVRCFSLHAGPFYLQKRWLFAWPNSFIFVSSIHKTWCHLSWLLVTAFCDVLPGRASFLQRFLLAMLEQLILKINSHKNQIVPL